jgi:DeoR family glycerol-3-phosphate regulon repressor
MILAGVGAGEVMVTGGVVRGPDGSMVGDDTTSTINRFRLEWAVIACSGVDDDGSVLDLDVLKVGVKRAMMARARRTMLVADGSKFARTALTHVATLDEIAVLVTDAPVTSRLAARAVEGGCRIVVAGEDRPK